ncbi:MAG: membrane dipeptidase [Erysipelotrichaceae bacterium]|nr:membrane dipeptidase [Erysipelotrichaceae bacterium]MDY5252937.1 membrane dipeptidase [Erysipelotrichaceae bacterium]
MRIFDLHADIGWDILDKVTKGHKDILKNEHLPKLAKGEIETVCVASFFDGQENWEQMQAMVEATRNEIASLQDEIVWVKKAEDLDVANKPKLIMSVEGMCGIVDDVEDKIQWLYDQGVRVASLCWNEENALASGVKGDVTNGLSSKGAAVIRKMDELGMVIDVSHTNENTFWDIVKIAQGPIIATHSNARNLCGHDRNLTKQQLKAISAKGGIIGLNAAKHFVAKNVDEQDAYHLALHGKYIADLIGVEHLAIGFDFMDFLEEGDHSSMAHDLKDASMAQTLIQALQKVGFSEKECQMIAHDNAKSLLQRVLR